MKDPNEETQGSKIQVPFVLVWKPLALAREPWGLGGFCTANPFRNPGGMVSGLGSLLGSFFFQDAVLYWGPNKGPQFRELPLGTETASRIARALCLLVQARRW